jgi:hypothetical protein
MGSTRPYDRSNRRSAYDSEYSSSRSYRGYDHYSSRSNQGHDSNYDRHDRPYRVQKPQQKHRGPIAHRVTGLKRALMEREEGECSEHSADDEKSSSGSQTLTWSSAESSPPRDAHYTELLKRSSSPPELSPRLSDPAVIADAHNRRFHSSNNAAYCFNWHQPHVTDLLLYMYERYNTVSVYSINMLKPGDIIYYLGPFVLDPDDKAHGWNVANVGGPECTARIKNKGRYAIVLSTYTTSVKVAEMTTFNHKGLQSKPTKVWPEYVGLRDVDEKDYYHPSEHKNKPLDVAWTACPMVPGTSVHLVTDKISLSSRIMIAGRITPDSLPRLSKMIKAVEIGTK